MSALLNALNHRYDPAPAPYGGGDIVPPTPADREKHRQQTERLDGIKSAFGSIPMGQAILDYLEEKKYLVMLCDGMPKDHMACALHLGIIALNPEACDADLVGAIAHEARHLWQFEQMPETPHPPPRVAVILKALKEADAHAFQQKYLESYAEATGDTEALDHFVTTRKHATAGGFYASLDKYGEGSASPPDFERFAQWMTALTYQGHYTDLMLGNIADSLGNDEERRLHSIDDMADTIKTAAHAIGGQWPYQNDVNYLSHLDGRAVAGMCTLSQEQAKMLCDLQEKWDALAKPKPGAAPAPKMNII
jgi:hypothetical protein